MRKLVMVLVLVTGVTAAHAAPLTIDAGNEDYFVTTNETVDEIRVGNVTDDNWLIVQSGATLTTTANHRLYLGYGATSSYNLVNVDGIGSSIDTTGDWTFVGLRGSENTLLIENGGTVNSYGGHVGYYPESVGNNVHVEETGSRWNLLSEHLYVGRDGDSNSVTISGGGTLAIEGDGKGLRVGVQPAADNNRVTVTGSGSLLSANDAIYVGQSGTDSSLTIAAGGSVSNGGDGFLGYIAGSSGTGTVIGIDSLWDNSALLHVGYYGTATLNVEAGGEVSDTSGNIAGYSGSTGVVTVTGPGSLWNNSNALAIGGHSSGAGGSGTLNLNDSGLVTVSGTTKLWNGGTLSLDGGSLTTGSLDNSDDGTLNFHDGTLTVNGAGGTFNPGTNDFTLDGSTATDRPELVVANTATATLSGDLTVGVNQQGKLSVEAASVVSNAYGYLGGGAGATGEATVTGSGSRWNNIGLNVGNEGHGTLSVAAGGMVSNSYHGYLGYDADATGVATVTGEGSAWNNSGSLYVGYEGNGTLNIEAGGVVSNAAGGIGIYSGSTGVATVTGTDSQWNTSSLTVAWVGNGTLHVEAGGVVSTTGNSSSKIGDVYGSTGVATVTGTGSSWSNSNNLVVGDRGNGNLTVAAGGVVSNSIGIIGEVYGSTGVATVTGPASQWNSSGNLVVGNSGDGTLNVQAGGVVSNLASYISGNFNSTGAATVTGAGSQWNNLGKLHVGVYNSGTLNVEAGGEVSSDGGTIGDYSGSTSVATVTGASSQWNNSDDLVVGGNSLSAGGSGTLNLNDGGLVTVSGTTRLWSTGTINLDGGHLTTGSFDNSDGGSLNFNDGTLTVNGTSGSFNPGTSDFTLDGSTATDLPELVIANEASYSLPGHLTVGLNQRAALTVEAGSDLLAGENYSGAKIGKWTGSMGVVTVTGTGSRWSNTWSLDVGYRGNGILNIEAGGVVSSNAPVRIGQHSNSTGVATVTGSGSWWNSGSSLTIGGDISGGGGNGTLNVSDSGRLTVPDLIVGGQRSGTLNVAGGGIVETQDVYVSGNLTGVATVTGPGSLWNNSDYLYVGYNDFGTLNVEAGGIVSNSGSGGIGIQTNSVGVVTVTDSGSQWNNSESLVVGNMGNGTLNVEEGGVVSDTGGGSYDYLYDSYIAKWPGSTGVATVTGPGSEWTNENSLSIGFGGSGTLNVNDSGLVTVSGTTKLGNGGTINLAGGNLTTGSFNNSDAGTLNFDNGTLTVNGASGSFNPGTAGFTIDGSTATDLPELVIAGTASTTLSGDLTVGSNKHGRLTVQSGGEVSNNRGHLGFNHGSTGIATVTGTDSKWTNSGDLIVGDSGDGTLNIEQGALVTTSLAGSVGRHGGTTGQVTVNSIGSTWNITNNLSVGTSGNGMLLITGGGHVFNDNGYLAWEAGSTGMVTVNGNGSTWTNYGDLNVGRSGSGSVNITDGGAVQVDGITQLFATGEINIDGGTMSIDDTLQLDTGSTVNLNSGTLSVSSFSGDGSLVWNAGTLEVTGPAGLTVGASGPLGSLLTIAADQTLNVTNATTIQAAAVITIAGGFSSDRLTIDPGGTLNASGPVAAKIAGLTTSSIVATGTLSVGDATGYGGFNHQGSLSVGNHSVTLNTKGFAKLGSMTTLDNGTLQAANGISLGIASVLTGSGTVDAKLAAGFGSTIEATADLNLGSATSVAGFFSDGELIVDTHTVTIHDQNIAVLGSLTDLGSESDGGTLVAAGGLLLEQGKDLVGRGLVTGDVVNDGNVYGDSSGAGGQLVFDAGYSVSGIGSFTNVQFDGTYSPGHSPAITHLTNTTFGSSATLAMELGGSDTQQYDQVTLDGTVVLAGNLEVQLINSFVPQVGDTFSLFDLVPSVDLQGGFTDILLPGLAGGLWDASGLLTSGNLLVISPGPDPCGLGGDAGCNTADLDALYAVMGTSVPPTDALFDLNSDNVVDGADLTEWLSLAAVENGHGSPYLPGDTDLDHDADLSDYSRLATNFDPVGFLGPHTWPDGNFDGDNDVDLSDYNSLASNFSPGGYGPAAVPEPSTLALLVVSVFTSFRRRRVDD